MPAADDAGRPGRAWARPAAAVLALLLVAGCTADDGPTAAPSAAPTSAPSASPSVGQRIAETVRAELGGVPLELEVADDPAERAVGLMGRDEVPDGTGMVFRFSPATSTRFYMFQVPVPLVAVFVRDGVVVHVAQMAPCTETDGARCPLYGPDAEVFDTVVETAPETLPDVRIGDRYRET